MKQHRIRRLGLATFAGAGLLLTSVLPAGATTLAGGTDAQGEVSCLVRDGDLTSTGQGAHTDIIMASALALLNALNKLEYRKRYTDRGRVGGP